jgi:hypothetical protein
MDTQWPASVIEQHVRDTIKADNIETVITFDGVSAQPACPPPRLPRLPAVRRPRPRPPTMVLPPRTTRPKAARELRAHHQTRACAAQPR